MTDQEINIAIAEACGWKLEPCKVRGGWKLSCETQSRSFWWNCVNHPTLWDFTHSIPDYCHDLNAMYEAENSLSEQEQRDYAHYVLPDVVAPGKALAYQRRLETMATARQRAEAFLRVKELWKE